MHLLVTCVNENTVARQYGVIFVSEKFKYTLANWLDSALFLASFVTWHAAAHIAYRVALMLNA